MKCPNCNHKLYEGKDGIKYCKNCSYVHKPNYKKDKKGLVIMTYGKILILILFVTFLVLVAFLIQKKFLNEYEATYYNCYNKSVAPLHKLDLYLQPGCLHCEKQKKILGNSLEEIGNIIDCTEEGSKCLDDGIRAVPSWKIQGEDEVYSGVHTFEELSELLGEYEFEWTCEDVETDVIFERKVFDTNISIEEALKIEKEVNRSFEEECLSFGGEFINDTKDIWTCRIFEIIPIINVTDVKEDWLNENCVLIQDEYKCFDEIKVRKK